ncbi:PSD1 and planctomycete cytochrome C domain-containing protein [Alienimonas californiensis]|uniref:Planctomycete cytochrome C n=1 Tax=Alienimonas californiensis TaxID=2527989 RepID=A0A517P5M4_9PLAN|nr:PSD1 and planctomycete cytochrome C domain-containing protein [Alienimonas californiensis]QDT14679.1 Planctomycete cytochrome C [Alienimonas californiensis]
MPAPLLLAALLVPAADAAAGGAGEVQFARDVRPIFNAHCSACHGGVREAGGLNLINEDSVALLVTPGDPALSYLLDRVTDPDDETRMPPAEHGPRLSDAEVATLTRWIEQGAAWGRHWSFEPPTRPTPPPTADAAWGHGPIDQFVLAKLEAAGLEPNPPAEPDRWLRRVSLDLIGLPPTPAERATFLDAVNEQGEPAYAAAVDRLLNSPHFGERWASVWLDQIRYADSRGLGLDRRRTAWPYRDWVIDAYNRDLPYDEFTIKQLAGDLLPGASVEDRVATAAHRLTQSNEEGGTDDEQFRTEAILDRVSTTWQVWQGLTMECVQCHAHPYDPLRHEEFYESAAFFNDTADVDLDDDYPTLPVPRDRADYQRAAVLDAEMEPLRRRLWEAENALLQDRSVWRTPTELTAEVSATPGIEVEETPEGPTYRLVGNVARGTAVTLTAPLPEGAEQLTAIRFTGLPVDLEAALKDAEWGWTVSRFKAELIPPEGEPRELKVTEVLFDEPAPARNPKDSLKDNGSGVGPYSKTHRPRSAAFVLGQPAPAEPGSQVRVTLTFNVFELSAFPLVARRGRIAFSDDVAFQNLWWDEGMAAERAELSRLERERRKIPSVPLPVMREREPSLARPTHRFDRGNMLSKAEPVSPGVPAVLGDPLSSEQGGSEADRLAFARWLVADANPLTARVEANRLWARLFGAGLVRTEEDFGSSGEPPSHPALLDYLAVRFQRDLGWSRKQLLREMVLSATYRQSAATTPELLNVDPNNRLLARGPRRRLSAETLRDQALHVAGLLTERLHGEPVHPPIPDGVWKPFSGDQWEVPAAGEPDRTRRSVYTYVKRSIPHPVMASFDAPSREFCTARRPESNTPVQALTILNDATFTEAAAALADRMTAAGDAPADRVAAGFLRVCGREPTERERAALVDLYTRLAALPDGPPATEIVAGALLNLDEALTN